jgi:hypothetical protein
MRVGVVCVLCGCVSSVLQNLPVTGRTIRAQPASQVFTWSIQLTLSQHPRFCSTVEHAQQRVQEARSPTWKPGFKALQNTKQILPTNVYDHVRYTLLKSISLPKTFKKLQRLPMQFILCKTCYCQSVQISAVQNFFLRYVSQHCFICRPSELTEL